MNGAPRPAGRQGGPRFGEFIAVAPKPPPIEIVEQPGGIDAVVKTHKRVEYR